MAYSQGTSSWDDIVRRSKEALPVVKVFSAAAAMGGLAVNYIVGHVDRRMAENSKELKDEFQELKDEFQELKENGKDVKKEFEKVDKQFQEVKKEIAANSKEIRYIALVMTERLAIVEAKLGVPNGRPLLSPQQE